MDLQNLEWSYEFILNNCDDDLRVTLIQECSALGSVGRTGPMAFYLLANKVIKTQANFSHNIISSMLLLSLKHFEGESVPDCVKVIRNMLTMLNYGHAKFDHTPPNLMELLYDIFLRGSNKQFVSWLQQTIDFRPEIISTPTQLFTEVSNYYDRIITKHDRVWIPTSSSKKKSSFIASVESELKQLRQELEANVSGQVLDKNRNGKYVIDRTPPKEGEPHERVNFKGFTEKWCSKCPKGGRWGNHSTEGHDEWYKEYRRKQDEKKARAEASENSNKEEKKDEKTSTSPVPSQPSSMESTTIAQTPRELLRRTYVSFDDSDSEHEF